nr:RNase H family protein [Vibrio sp. D173a]
MTTTKTIDVTEINYAYTDGACITQEKRGGWGFVLARGEKRLKRSGGELQTTSNRMELTAAIKTTKALPRQSSGGLFRQSVCG